MGQYDLEAKPRPFALTAEERSFALEAAPRTFALEAKARKVAIVAPSPFLPSDLANLEWWVAADDAATLFQQSDCTVPAVNDGDLVGCWQDKSGNGNHVTEATNRPTLRLNVQNGLPAIRFDGMNDLLERNVADVNTDFTLFVAIIARALGQPEHCGVFSSSALGTIADSFQLDTGGPGACNNQYRWRLRDNAGANQDVCIDTYLIQAQLIELKAVTSAPRTQETWLDGVAKGNAAHDFRGRFEWFRLGTNRGGGIFFNGDILEGILYYDAKSDGDRILVEEYLRVKWAIW